MTSKQQILARVEQAFRVTDDQLNNLVLGFNEEMKAGLDDTNRATKGSELKMIPSYVTGKRIYEILFFFNALNTQVTDTFHDRLP